MGFPKVSFRPSFFPYTEPSVEVFGWLESKKAWIELGGAGIFRAEVTRPFNCDVPVLAWGLSMERVAMMRFGLDDIRKLYWSDLDWLREAELCR
jgi:phenylalanyl-tRNA synthetase alpha chain